MDKLNFVWAHKPEGSFSQYTSMYGLAWEEFPEFQFQPKAQFVHKLVTNLVCSDRIEAAAFVGDTLAGVAAFALDDDIHVGPCLSVMHHYVLPEYRNGGIARGFMRMLYHSAKELGVPVVAYTHRLRPGVYNTTYRKVPNVKSRQESDEHSR